jgi:hypothetical protein
VKKIKLYLTVMIVLIVLSGCAGIVTFRNPNKPKAVKTSGEVKVLKPVKFEDFENGTLVGAYGYANTAGGASVKYMMGDPSEDKAHGGQYCAKAVFNTGTNSDWGCGYASASSYGSGFIDATDRQYITFWANLPENVTFYVFVNEAGANGGDGEFWNGPSLTGSGKWVEYTVPLDEMFKNIYSGSQMGNNELDKSGIAIVGFQIGGNQGKGKFLVDDIWFK